MHEVKVPEQNSHNMHDVSQIHQVPSAYRHEVKAPEPNNHHMHDVPQQQLPNSSINPNDQMHTSSAVQNHHMQDIIPAQQVPMPLMVPQQVVPLPPFGYLKKKKKVHLTSALSLSLFPANEFMSWPH